MSNLLEDTPSKERLLQERLQAVEKADSSQSMIDAVEALALVVVVAEAVVDCCCCVNCVNCVVGSVKTSSERNVVPGEEEEDKVRCGSDCGDSTTMECR